MEYRESVSVGALRTHQLQSDHSKKDVHQGKCCHKILIVLIDGHLSINSCTSINVLFGNQIHVLQLMTLRSVQKYFI